jgi:AcrR family transcriptional regulator
MHGKRDPELQPLFDVLNTREARALGPARVAAHQRKRIMRAMVIAVDRFGYQNVTIEKLVGLAGVSRSAFYRQFRSKQQCFLDTLDDFVRSGAEQIEAAFYSADGVAERLEMASKAFLSLALDEIQATRLIFLDSFELGAAGAQARERATQLLEQLLRAAFAGDPEVCQLSPVTIRGIAGGVHQVVYRRLRDAEPERLEDEMPQLIAWILEFGEPMSWGSGLIKEIQPKRGVAAKRGARAAPADWERSPKAKRARERLSQRERIVRGTAQVVAKRGYESLSVEAISRCAGVSNQTFYEQFSDKDEAFLAAFDSIALMIFEYTAAAFLEEADWLQRGTAAMAALLDFFASYPLPRRVAIVELAMGGPAARARAEAMLDAFTGFLEPEHLPPSFSRRPSRVVLEAIAGGVWAIVQNEVDRGRADRLSELTLPVIDFVLAAFSAPPDPKI